MADKEFRSITFPGLPDRYVLPDYSEDFQNIKDNKVDKEAGKGLSANDYTTEDKDKLGGIESGANKTVVDDELSDTSENPVQNKVVTAALEKADNALSDLGLSVVNGKLCVTYTK